MTKKSDEIRWVLEDWLKLPRIEISEREWKAARWRWEFLRLKDDYKKQYRDIKIKGEPKVPPQVTEWGHGMWFDPNLSFEKLYDLTYKEVLEEKIEDIDNEMAAKFLLFQRMGGQFYRGVSPGSPGFYFFNEDEVVPENITLTIDLSIPDSEIIEQVKRWLTEFRSRLKKEKLPWDWDKLPVYHEVVTLDKQGKSANEIADIIFPEPDPYSDDESVPDLDLESVRRKVFRYLETGKDLIEGGYKKIK